MFALHRGAGEPSPPGSWGGGGELSLSVTIGVRHLAGTRKSGITQETEIVAELRLPRC